MDKIALSYSVLVKKLFRIKFSNSCNNMCDSGQQQQQQHNEQQQQSCVKPEPLNDTLQTQWNNQQQHQHQHQQQQQLQMQTMLPKGIFA